MRVAYVDSSCVVARAFGEPGGRAVADCLAEVDLLVSSSLLEAEVRSAFARERVTSPCEPWFGGLTWLHPDRPLGPECRRVLEAGYVRGADLWHLACALFLSPDPSELAFASLDIRQRDVAEALGLRLLPTRWTRDPHLSP